MKETRVVLGTEEFMRLVRGLEVESEDGTVKIVLSDLGFEWMAEMIDEAAEEASQRVSP
jgi:hypothetical protein